MENTLLVLFHEMGSLSDPVPSGTVQIWSAPEPERCGFFTCVNQGHECWEDLHCSDGHTTHMVGLVTPIPSFCLCEWGCSSQKGCVDSDSLVGYAEWHCDIDHRVQ